jgi:crotonobetainyl-CoA:carnitine CoA-transferase CaiB-like acyl-CoA transferase
MLPLLSGLRIVDITTVILGPYATQILGDLGAEVVKVEPLAGDSMRPIPPAAAPGLSAIFANHNRNKRSIALDLKHADGKAVLARLIGHADALVHNIRPEAMDRLGFGFDACRALNPRLVYCAAVGFGSRGPYAGRPAYDDIIQAASGFAGLFGMRDGAPVYAPSIVADKVAGLHVVYAVLAALLHRERTGGAAMQVEVPMFEAMAAFALTEHLAGATFEDNGEMGYHRALSTERRPYTTADGWIAVLPYTAEQWSRVLAEIGRPDIAKTAWFKDASERSRRIGELYELLSEVLLGKGTRAWLEVFDRLDVPCAPVNSPQSLLEDPHLAAVSFFEPRFASESPVRRTLSQAMTVADVAPAPDRPPPPLGADTRAVLADLGYSAEEIAALARSPGIGGLGSGG